MQAKVTDANAVRGFDNSNFQANIPNKVWEKKAIKIIFAFITNAQYQNLDVKMHQKTKTGIFCNLYYIFFIFFVIKTKKKEKRNIFFNWL